jgi:hypothetical protein
MTAEMIVRDLTFPSWRDIAGDDCELTLNLVSIGG